MAEKVIFNVAGGIISSVVGPLAAEEFRLSWVVKQELEKLKNRASTIKAVLLDAEEQLAKGHAISDWHGKLNDILYKADDFLDAVSTDALQQELMARDKMAKKVNRFFSKPIQIVYNVRMAHKIKAIRGSLDALAADMEKFQFVVRHVETPVGFVGRDSTYSFVREEDVIGRDNDKEAIIGSLLDTKIKEKVSILPIVGIGGLGKTTLAQLVFNDNRIHNNFEQRMWVCVSDNFDIKVIIEKILESATNRQQEDVEIEILINYLQTEIEGKRYFLVLDDVWNENLEKWLKLKSLLMVGASGSRILLTTRGTNVAKITHTIDPYFLKGLEENASWNLFKSMIFVNHQAPKTSKMVEIGKEILKKCAGVPLAVRTIGRLLNSKNTEIEWMAFRDIDLAKIPQTKDTDILLVLKLSYDKLPSYLKHCFAYCSLFPKNYEFNVSMLISHWIAHGFIESLGEKQCWEDVGCEYFKYLLWRLFFQEVRTDEWGNIRYCKMHDLMHDLAILVAGSLITIFDDKNKDISQKTQHISLGGRINFSQEELILLSKASRMRTLIGLGSNIDVDFRAIFSCFKFLRILSMKNKKINCVLNSIEKLKHLRYLHIDKNSDIIEVPNSVTKLINLQTLKLTRCPKLMALPKDIKKLANLRHLDICNRIFIPRGLGELTKLQTLLKFSVDSVSRDNARFNELIELNNLRGHLDICYEGDVGGVAPENKGAKFLKDKLHLNSLLLQWYDTTGNFDSSTSDENANDSDFDMEELLECLEPH